MGVSEAEQSQEREPPARGGLRQIRVVLCGHALQPRAPLRRRLARLQALHEVRGRFGLGERVIKAHERTTWREQAQFTEPRVVAMPDLDARRDVQANPIAGWTLVSDALTGEHDDARRVTQARSRSGRHTARARRKSRFDPRAVRGFGQRLGMDVCGATDRADLSRNGLLQAMASRAGLRSGCGPRDLWPGPTCNPPNNPLMGPTSGQIPSDEAWWITSIRGLLEPLPGFNDASCGAEPR